MANYQLLKADIDAKVYENAQQKITGENLNSVLNQMVTTLGAEYQFAGVATKDTNPETTDAKVFYIANGKGTYTHFDNIDVTEDDVVILYYDNTWHKVATGIASQAKLTELAEIIAIAGKNNIHLSHIGGIVYTTGARGGSSNFTNYYVFNDNYKKIRCRVHVQTTDTNAAAIAFYTTDTISENGYISGVKAINDGQYHWYEADIPDGTKLIAISNKHELGADYDLFIYNPIEELNTDIKKCLNSISSIVEKDGQTTLPIKLKDCTLTHYITIYGQYSSGYDMATPFVCVVPNSTINFAYTPLDVDGETITPLVRIGFYADKDMATFISVYKQSYDRPANIVVPPNAKYMKVGIGLGINKYCWRYYVDGAVSIFFNDGYPYDFKRIFAQYNNGYGSEWCKIQKSNLRRGYFQANGEYEPTSGRSTTREMFFIRPDVTEIKMVRPDNVDIYLYGLTWYDENNAFIGRDEFDNYESIPVRTGAKFAYITIEKNNENFYGENIPDNFAMYVNMSDSGFDDDKNSIIEQNNTIETVVKLAQIKQPAKVNGVKQTMPLSLLYFSDIHGNNKNLTRLIHFNEYYNGLETTPYIDVMLSGGDNVNNYLFDNTFNFGSIPGAGKILNTVGNHDAMANAALTIFANKKDVYDTEFKPFISNWGVVQPTNAEQDGLMYYYKDFATNKIRLIVLDCIFWTDAQLSWFESALTGARTAGYSVVAVSHYPIGNTTIINCNFNSADYNPTAGARLTNPIQAVNNFIADGGEFICWLGGHTHTDGFGTVANNNGQLNLIIDTAFPGSAAQDAATIIGTKTQDCFNVIGFDVYSKLIKVVRIGRDYDRHLRHIGEMCVDYSTKQILYTR